MAEYRFSPAAERDIESIWNYSAENWGVEQANQYVDSLKAAFSNLASSPSLAHACEVRPSLLRYRVNHHTVYFRVTSYGIAIVRVLHSKMDARRYL